MRRIFGVFFGSVVLIGLGLGCAGSGGDVDKREDIARQEAARLQQPNRPLSSYAHFELLPATTSASINENEDKVAYAEKLENLIAERLQPLFLDWASAGGGSGTLQIRPEIEHIKIVSGSARFWGGAWAGSSTIDMNLALIDAASGDIVAKPRVMRSADAMAGAWSVGATDQNLFYYIADIAYQYLVASH